VRWDPFKTYIDQNGHYNGQYTSICPLRSGRPLETGNVQYIDEIRSVTSEDSFCRILNGELPLIELIRDDIVVQDPLTTSHGFFNPSDRNNITALTIINLYSPTGRIYLQDEKKVPNQEILYRGISLVHVFSDHYETIEEVPVEKLAKFLVNVALSHETCLEAMRRNKRDESVIIPYFFFNIGRKAGASIAHLHAQSILNHGSCSSEGGSKWSIFSRTFAEYRRLTENSNFCLACEYRNHLDKDPLGQALRIKERTIYQNDDWIAVVAYSPERDGHIRIIPLRHCARLTDIRRNEFFSLAEILIVVNKKLTAFINKFAGKKLGVQTDRNILIRQPNYGNASDGHLIFEIIPSQSIGGAELSDDHRISQLFPEDVARMMRKQ